MVRSRSRSPKRGEKRRSRSKERERDRERDVRRRPRSKSRSPQPEASRRNRSRSPRRRRSPSPRRRSRSNEDNDVVFTGTSYIPPEARAPRAPRAPRQPRAPKHNILASELAGKTAEEVDMMRLMGFGGFDTTKNKHVPGADVSAANIVQKRKYRQYMNRRGGFNRPLDFVA